ncbi:MAG: hypothetical protein ABI624_09955 [Casimicrobiaceae bacterium]
MLRSQLSSYLQRGLAVVSASVLVGIAGCGDDVTPQNTAIAGRWQVACQPVNEDCPNFGIAFSADGDITDVDLDGHKGPQRGTGEIVDATLIFKLGFGGVYAFSGKLDGGGRSASGTMTNFDYDGKQKSTPAVVSRQ